MKLGRRANMNRTIVECECEKCGGTGLYTGEGNTAYGGAAFVCPTCNGTGKIEISYTKFVERKEMKGITRVFYRGRGIVKDRKIIPDFECSYEDWKKQIIVECECEECGGTGLYTRNSTYDGAAFVCLSCDGTGKIEISYIKFEGRKEKEGIIRVFEKDFGNTVYGKDTDVDGKLIRFSKYGCSYEDWKKGVKLIPIEELHCPFIHYNCSAFGSLEKTPCSRCIDGVSNKGWAYDCTYFSDKAECWKEWHRNND